jgi:hypothetical protein
MAGRKIRNICNDNKSIVLDSKIMPLRSSYYQGFEKGFTLPD